MTAVLGMRHEVTLDDDESSSLASMQVLVTKASKSDVGGILNTALARRVGVTMTEKPSGETQRVIVDTIGTVASLGALATLGPGGMFVMFGTSYISNPKNGFIDEPEGKAMKRNMLADYRKMADNIARVSSKQVESVLQFEHGASFDAGWSQVQAEARDVLATTDETKLVSAMRCNLGSMQSVESAVKGTKEKFFKRIAKANSMGEQYVIQEELNAEVVKIEADTKEVKRRLCESLCGDAVMLDVCCNMYCTVHSSSVTSAIVGK